jgi:hypothetical protein
MRKIAWGLLLFFAFAIPWEYSLDLGEPLGNVARIIGLLLLLVAIPAILQAGRLRTPGPMQWLVLAFYLWFCCTYFWTIEPQATLDKMRGCFQEMMIVWIVCEFAESSGDLRSLLRAYVAGSWVLAALTVANLASAEAIAAGGGSVCRRRTGSERCGPISRLRFPAGSSAPEQREALAGAAAGARLSAAGPGSRGAHGLPRRAAGRGGGAGGLRPAAGQVL